MKRIKQELPKKEIPWKHKIPFLSQLFQKQKTFRTKDRKVRLIEKNRKKYLLILLGSFCLFVISFALYINKNFFSKRLSPAIPKTFITPGVSDTSLDYFKEKLYQKGIELSDLTIATDGARISGKTTSGTTVILDRFKNADWQVDSLQEILLRLTIDNKIPQVVDLRYSKPLVKY